MNRIKELRKKQGISQQKLADILEVHQTAVSQWETGRTAPDIEASAQMARMFHVSVEYLLGLEEETPTESELKGVDFALYREASDLTAADKEDVLKFIHFLKNRKND